MEQSEQIDKLATALAKAQASVEGAKKDSANPHFKSKYADLESVWAACRDALTSNGLTVIQSPGLTHDGVMHMSTQLNHSSGQWVRGEMSLPLQKVDPQGAGSALTYMRRYALAAFVGVAPEDDDGNAASRPSAQAVANDAPSPSVKLNGPYTSHTALKTAYQQLDRNIRTWDEPVAAFDEWIAADKQVDLIEQLKRDARGYVFGSDKLPAEHVPLLRLIENKRAELRMEDEAAGRVTNILASG